jgi:signal transduction histidine kinase
MCFLEIRDEGKGIPSQLLEQAAEDWMGALGVGLRGMNERMSQLGGRLEVVSKDSGTVVTAVVPTIDSPPAEVGR